MERGFIDRWEGDLAVIEINGKTIEVARSRLPKSAQPGDAVTVDNGDVELDPETTAKRKQEIADLMDELFE